MSNFFLVKAKVTHTQYIAVKASDEDAAEYIAAGVISGVINPYDDQHKEFVSAIDSTDYEIEDTETVDITEAPDMNVAVDDFTDYLELCVYDEDDDAFDDNEGESEEYYSD